MEHAASIVPTTSYFSTYYIPASIPGKTSFLPVNSLSFASVSFSVSSIDLSPSSRLIKRRTVANEVADAGRILINGKVAKASQAVNAGDIIEVTFGNRPIKVKVLSDVEPRTKDVAREMYEIISE